LNVYAPSSERSTRFARMDPNRNAGAKPRAFCGRRNLSVLNRGLVRFRTFVPAVFSP
jgi:hypothetical protein